MVNSIDNAKDNDVSINKKFRIRLVIKFFQFDPNVISNALELEPDRCWRIGETRNIPGHSDYKHKYNAWLYAINSDPGEEDFFDELSNLLVYLDNRKDIFRKIVEFQGKSFIAIDLPGDVNIGSVIGYRYLSILSSLNIDLSVEVFPTFS